MFDIDQLREDTPGTKSIFHFNNAGAALAPKTVTKSISDYLHEEALCGGYELESFFSERIKNVYTSIAKLLGCTEEEIAITNSGSYSWNSIVYGLNFEKGDKILVSQHEYGSNIASLRHICATTEAELIYIKNDAQGQICLQSLQENLDAKVKLVAITHIACNNALVNPVSLVGEIVSKTPSFYLVDACQSIGQVTIDVKSIKCDALVTTARKWLRGPRGIGFAYIGKSKENYICPAQIEQYTLQSPQNILSDLKIRSGAKKIELSEKNYALILGLGVAVDYALQLGIENIERRIGDLSSYLRKQLSQIKGVYVRDLGTKKCGIVTFTVDGYHCTNIKNALLQNKINVSVMPSFLSPLSNIVEIIRASPHYYLQNNDIDHFCLTLRKILGA
ncbi:aminotransferase class V-fold PLP-dependent enzyme [Candidatus Uabimicrobium sp. HlEnr_7]|uniref:aminotransferase class V-fold PLP-dependent enzyme n=1 Tax=Candidatus Uabimicrobium helgolandensis TaxID=3095367 RepID=UPI003557A2CA